MARALWAAGHQDPIGANRLKRLRGGSLPRNLQHILSHPLRQSPGLDDDHVCLGHEKFDRGPDHVLGFFIFGLLIRIEGLGAQMQHQRHLAVVCRDLRDGADRLGRGYCADLDRLHGHVFQYASRLVVDLLGTAGNDGFRIGSVLRGHRRQDGKGMHAQGRASHRVGRQAIGTRWIKRAKNKGDWQRIFRHSVSPASVL